MTLCCTCAPIHLPAEYRSLCSIGRFAEHPLTSTKQSSTLLLPSLHSTIGRPLEPVIGLGVCLLQRTLNHPVAHLRNTLNPSVRILLQCCSNR